MPATIPPCPQAASGGGVLPAPLNPLLFGIEDVPPVPARAPAVVDDANDYADDPSQPWPFRLPAWNAIDCLWWLMLGRAVYWDNDTWVRRVAAWAGPVLRLNYAPPLAPPAVGHAFIELQDQYLCVIAGTNSDAERNAYLMGHALESTTLDVVGQWRVNTQWYNRAQTVLDAYRLWAPTALKPTVAIGHSSGGAEASVLALRRYGDLHPTTVHAVTFGSPRWSSPTVNTYVFLEKAPQFIEFTTPGDPVPLVPPPWSVVDALRLNYNLWPRPEYLRPGQLLVLLGAWGVEPRDAAAYSDLYEAAQQVLRANLTTANHATPSYTATALHWAQSHCAANNSLPVIAGLVQILAEMDAAGV